MELSDIDSAKDSSLFLYAILPVDLKENHTLL
jgi:hypothetical protein